MSKELKAIKTAIGNKQFDVAKEKCLGLLESVQDYHAYVFLGVAELNLKNYDESEQAYKNAIALNSNDKLAFQGLLKLYEDQKYPAEKLLLTLYPLRDFYFKSNDVKKLVETLSKIVSVSGSMSDNLAEIDALSAYTEESAWFDMIKSEENVISPLDAWKKMATLQESADQEKIKSEIEIRRKRLSAETLDEIKTSVEKSVVESSQLDHMYLKILSIERTAEIEEKYLEVLNRKLLYSSDEGRKNQLSREILKVSRLMVESKSRSLLPYQILLDTSDEYADSYDSELLECVCEFFPNTSWGIVTNSSIEMNSKNTIPNVASLLKSIEKESTLFQYHVSANLCLDVKNYQAALELALTGQTLLKSVESRYMLELPRVKKSLLSISAASYLGLGGNRNLQNALDLYKQILSIYAPEVSDFKGFGRTLTKLHKYNEAIKSFEKLKSLFPDNLEGDAEIGWIWHLNGDSLKAKSFLEGSIDKMTEMEESSSIIAVHICRLGIVLWNLDEKQDAFALWIRSVKFDPQLLTAFTYLGHYYREVEGDRVRAKKCYQRAVSGSTQEHDAAQSLIALNIEEGDTDSALEIAEAIVSSDDQCAWAWRQLGFIRLNTSAVTAANCFQRAIRIDSQDALSWEGLADAYFKEGKYMASSKAFGRVVEIAALTPAKQQLSTLIYTHTQLGAIRYKIGLFLEAIDAYDTALGLSYLLQFDEELEDNFLDTCQNFSLDGFHVVALHGLANVKLTYSQELISAGSFGKAIDLAIESAVHAMEAIVSKRFNTNGTFSTNETQISGTVTAFKALGDALAIIRLLPHHSHMIKREFLLTVLQVTESSIADIHAQRLPLDSKCRTEISDKSKSVSMNMVLYAAGCAYRAAITLAKKSQDEFEEVIPELWSDLAVCYFERYRFGEDNSQEGENDDTLIVAAIKCTRVALQNRSFDDGLWNAMGVFMVAAKSVHPGVAQHAFIKALELNPKCGTAWTNLGFLYLRENDLELAEKAFVAARSTDPENALCWLGSAFVMEKSANKNREKKMPSSTTIEDIVEHAYEISSGSVSEVNYRLALQTLHKSSQHAVPPKQDPSILNTAVFCMLKFVECNVTDGPAFNLLGLLFERQGNYERAVSAFTSALQNISESDMEYTANVLENKSRALCAAGLYTEAAVSYGSVIQLLGEKVGERSVRNIYLLVGAGLSLYFSGQLESALNQFEAALKMVEELKSGGEKSEYQIISGQVIVFVAQVLYALGTPTHVDLAKRELLRCVQLNPNNVKPLLGLYALALTQNDLALAQSAAVELLKELSVGSTATEDKLALGASCEDEENVADALSAFFLAQGSNVNGVKVAKGILSRLIRRRPWIARRWLNLAEMLLKNAKVDHRLVLSLTLSASKVRPISGNAAGDTNSDQPNISSYQYMRIELLSGFTNLNNTFPPSVLKPNSEPVPSQQSDSADPNTQKKVKKENEKNRALQQLELRRASRRALAKAVRACPSSVEAWSAFALGVRSEVAVVSAHALSNVDIEDDGGKDITGNSDLDTSLPEVQHKHIPKELRKNWWHTVQRVGLLCSIVRKISMFIQKQAILLTLEANKLVPPSVKESSRGRSLKFAAIWAMLISADVSSISFAVSGVKDVGVLQTAINSTEQILGECLKEMQVAGQKVERVNEYRRIASTAYVVLGRLFARLYEYTKRADVSASAIKAFQQALTLRPEWCAAWEELGTVYLVLGRSDQKQKFVVAADMCFRQAISTAENSVKNSSLAVTMKKKLADEMKLSALLRIGMLAMESESGKVIVNEVAGEVGRIVEQQVDLMGMSEDGKGTAKWSVDPKSSRPLAISKLIQGIQLLQQCNNATETSKGGNSHPAVRAAKIFYSLTEENGPGIGEESNMIGDDFPWANYCLGLVAKYISTSDLGTKGKEAVKNVGEQEFYKRELGVQPGNAFILSLI
ncbi:Superkiller protein 3 [Nowakowskiella sp. JEL0407]|nr:Superkiller protein 3 [Nowakowskiella sp. JEL0407]